MPNNDVFDGLEHVDQYVYHYTTHQKGLEDILPTMKLRLSPLTVMNDPKEAKHLRLIIHGMRQDINAEPEKTMDTVAETTAFLNEIQKEHKALCFSMDSQHILEAPKQYQRIYRGYNKPTLWAHYADNHQGICLIFDKDKLLKSVNNEFGSSATYQVYEENLVAYDVLENILAKFRVKYDEFLKTEPSKWLQEYYKRNYAALLFTKTVDWQVENEFRIVIRSKLPDEFLYLPIQSSLCGIVLGPDFPSEQEKTLRSYRVPFGRLVWSDGLPLIKDKKCLP